MADFSILIQFWFRQNQRKLPWRGTSDPYKIWLSEIILQQTRVDQGLNYYLKFVEHYPTINDLASAPEDDVLNLWQGLGYYSRARNMHFSAKLVAEELDGKFPKTHKGVLALKGVGEYTAAAITSIAYGLPHAVVDGNVYRVLSRYLLIDIPIDTTDGKKAFALAADELLDTENPGDHNQAIMELGALICLPKNPKCNECPVNESCQAFHAETQLNYPVKSKKIKVKDRYFNYLVFTDGKNTILKKRVGKDIWTGLYDFPLIELERENDINKDSIGRRGILDLDKDGRFKHILSHQKIHAIFWLVKVEELELKKGEKRVPLDKLDDYPMPQLLVRYLDKSTLFNS